MKEKLVAICMSTFNGEQFLKEQLDSINNQSYKKFHLFIRDDGSSDTTIEIITDYIKRYDNLVLVNQDESDNLGPTNSFLRLIEYAVRNPNGYDYFAFADQDDVWLEGKIEHAIEKLEGAKPSKYGKLYYSNKTIVDKNLRLLYQENINYYGDFLECLCTNLASGCTMVFDRNFAELLIVHKPQCDCYHDAWAYRIAKILGSTIVFDTESGIMYRQHEHNVVGIGKKTSVSFTQRIHHLFEKEGSHYILFQIQEIISYFHNEIEGTNNEEMYSCLLQYRESILARIRLLFLLYPRGLSYRTFSEKLIWYNKILRKRF